MGGACLCLGRRAGLDCKRRPAAELAIYTDPRGQLWGLCGRQACARAYNGVEASVDVRAKADVRAAEDKPAAAVNRFAALLRRVDKT